MNFRFRLISTLLFGCFPLSASGAYRIDTVAGSANAGDNGPALHAPLRDCQGVAVDRVGNIYVADAGDHRIRKIDSTGTITTVAGTGIPGGSGDDGPAALAQLNLPYGVTADAAGNIYIADLGNNRIRRISSAGIITSLKNTFQAPRNVLADGQGNVYVSEFDGNRVRRISPDGIITVIAGTGLRGRTGDFGPATAATLNSPAGLALDSAGALYIADSGNAEIRKVAGGMITTVLGNGSAGSASPAQLNLPTGVTLDAFSNLYIADSGNGRIRKLSASGTVSTLAFPARDVAVDFTGNLLIAYTDRVSKLLVSGAAATVAGDGSFFLRGDGGAATEARLNAPVAIAISSAGLLTIADTGNSRVRTILASGTIMTTTGGTPLRTPAALSFDAQGMLLIADPSAFLVWKFGLSTLAAVAGTGSPNYVAPGFSALASSLSLPSGVVAIPTGGFYVADTANNRVRRVTAEGSISTVAGADPTGPSNVASLSGGPLNGPTALALDAAGNLYIADTGSDRVRKLTPDGQLTTVAGGAGAAFILKAPRGLAIDPYGVVWIADTGSHRILTMASDGTLALAAGTGSPGFAGDGADALSAQLQSPSGLAADLLGNIYVADTGNNRIRILIAPPPAVTESAGSGFTVVGAASLLSGPAAPCALVTVFGPNADKLAFTFDGLTAVLAASAPNQATLQVPCSAGLPSVLLAAGNGWRATLPIALAAPALFALNAGAGQALALNIDNTSNSALNPAARGSIVTLYATGMGLLTNPVGVLVGRAAADILFSGDAPNMIGVSQINIRLPPDAAGVQPLTVLSLNIASQTAVTLAIQ